VLCVEFRVQGLAEEATGASPPSSGCRVEGVVWWVCVEG
jgi:hypothetical protein